LGNLEKKDGVNSPGKKARLRRRERESRTGSAGAEGEEQKGKKFFRCDYRGRVKLEIDSGGSNELRRGQKQSQRTDGKGTRERRKKGRMRWAQQSGREGKIQLIPKEGTWKKRVLKYRPQTLLAVVEKKQEREKKGGE